MNRHIRSVLIILGIGALVLLLDRASKLWILENLKLYESWDPIPALAPYFQFFRTTNTGVAFGMLQGGGMLFAIVNSVAIIGIIIYGYRQNHDSILVDISLGLMLGGAAGNLIDRLLYGGEVVDFLLTQIPGVFQFATFNVADSAVVVGVILLVILLFLEERKRNPEEPALADQA